MQSLDDHARAALVALDSAGRRRALVPTARQPGSAGPVVQRNGRSLVSFSCNDTLGLATHPRVIAASMDATRSHGAGAGASRLVTGDQEQIHQLEARLAQLCGSEACCVFGSGYLANAGVIPALVERGDLVLVDELAHSCIFAGAVLSGARIRRFRHNDLDHVAQILKADRAGCRHALIATEHVFSMDGDLAPVPALAAQAIAMDAWLLVDDAHGFGVVPMPSAHVPIKVGTLSKAAGSYGGYVCASSDVVDLVRNRARTLIYSTGLPPGVVAAALAGVEILAADPVLRARPLRNARLFAAAAGLPPPASPIVKIVLGAETSALAASKWLEEQGFLVVAIRPPTVPDGTSRLRLTFAAGHDEADILRLADLVRQL